MDTRIIKAIIALGILAWAIQQFVAGNIVSGILLVLAAALAGLLIFRSLRLIWVFWNLRQEKIDKATSWLGKINPDRLFKRQEAYFYFLSGLCSMGSAQKASASEKHFRKALGIGLKMDHDKAVAKFNLAQIAAMKRRKREALNLLTEVKKLDSKNMLKEQVKMLKEHMKRL